MPVSKPHSGVWRIAVMRKCLQAEIVDLSAKADAATNGFSFEIGLAGNSVSKGHKIKAPRFDSDPIQRFES